MGGTMTFTRHHKGAYMDLLMAQFNNGHLSINDIEHILGVDMPIWELKLKQKFISDSGGLFYNKKLEEEVCKRRNFTTSRRHNLESKHPHMDKHMVSHMENENVNENVNKDIINNNNIIKRKQRFVKPTIEQVKQYCLETKSTIDPEEFWHNYESSGWIKANGQSVLNWKSTIKTWEKREKKNSPKPRSKGCTPEEYKTIEKAKEEKYMAEQAKTVKV